MTPLEYAMAEREAALGRLMEFLRIPSVSTVPERAGDVQRAAAWVADRLRAAGLTGVRIDPTDRHPVVYGEWLGAPGAPTVLIYSHYDVQPPDPLDLWTTPPFEPHIRDGELFARGSSDDKGQGLIHWEALGAYLQTDGRLPVNVKVVVEGEEEIGSPNLEAWIRSNAESLTADVALVSDTSIVAPGTPSIVYGLRGLAYFDVEVDGPTRDLHSGQFGGAVLNPIHVLAEIIAQLHDANGTITIPGFYDRVRAVDEVERGELAKVPFDLGAFQRSTGAAGGWGERDYSILERLGARPALDVNGIWGGWTGAGAKTVLPAKAFAKISMRLVPDQDPLEVGRLFKAHLAHLVPAGATLTVRDLHGGWPALVDRKLPAMRAAAVGYEAAFGRAPVYTREGGSIPVVATFQQVLGIPTVLMGFGLPDDNLHSPDEKFRVEHFHKGVEAIIAFLAALPAASGG